jgi:hypothetical protein
MAKYFITFLPYYDKIVIIILHLGTFLITTSKPVLMPTQPPIQCVPGVGWPEREADHLRPPSVTVKNAWSYTSTPQCLHGVVLN